MKIKRAPLGLGAVLLIGTAFSAAAADLGGYGDYGGSIKDGPIAAPISSPSPTWYLRVDGGYSEFDDPTMTENDIYDLTESSIDGTWSVGGGVGMYFGGGFRGDITVDYRFEADARGVLPDPKAELPGSRDFGIKSTVALANLYYDFNWGSRFTPYLGVGLGFAHNTTTNGSVTDLCGCYAGSIEGDSQTDVAAALMAGFSMKLRGGDEYAGGSFKDGFAVSSSTSRSLYLDVGYRFLYLGEAATGPVKAVYSDAYPGNGHGTGDVVSQDPKVEDIHAHELRVGLRYNMN